MTDSHGSPTVAVVGGGLAGMAAAAALRQRGLHVELFEQRKRLGGRAASFQDPKTGQLIDHCQHVSMGCCTGLADFCRRTGISGCFRRYRRLHLFGPDGKRRNFAASRLLPAPLHLVPGLMRLDYLTCRQRLGIVRTMRRLAREPLHDARHEETIGAWLRRHGQSDRAIERFWSVVLVGALGERVDRASLAAAGKVFVDGFLASRGAWELEVPRLPLGEIFDRRAGTWLAGHGVVLHRGTPVKQIDGDASRATAVVLSDGTRREFDFIVAAVPWRRVRPLFGRAMLAAMPALDGVEEIQPAPITAVHLWFDRPITSLPHAVLVGRLSQWLFGGGRSDRGHYYQVVISASHALVGRDREEVLGQVRHELGEIFPAAGDGQLLHWRVITHPAAVFSVTPGIERFRPAQQTPIANLLLAGDWTATGWPATMEGAVRSGQLAADAVLQALGKG